MTTTGSSASPRAPLPLLVWVYFAAVALVGVAFIAAFTVGTVAVFVVTDSRGLTGLPATTGTLGTAAAAAILSAVMARRGRRIGLLAGLAVGVAGATLALAALALALQPIVAMALLLAGFVGLGFANSAAQLARYAAAELVPAADRGRAVGIVVWAGTVGAVVGPNLPNLVAPSEGTPAVGDLMVGFGAVVAVMIAAFVVLALLGRRGPAPAADEPAGSDRDRATSTDSTPPLPSLAEVFRLPPIRIGLVTLLTAGVAMVSIMTMTPIHLIEHGHGLATVGLVLSAHTLGMFALSPISGRLADRIGPLPVIAGGFAVMVGAAVLAASAPVDGGPILAVALFLLGFGWNLAFVSGSALLARDVPQHLQIRLQGLTDSLIWASAAAASALAGIVLELTSYPLLALVGAGLALVPIALIVLQRRAPAAAAA